MIFSNTEFYYADSERISSSEIILEKNESKHVISVMRHKIGDEINITDGIGNVYKSAISKMNNFEVTLKPISKEYFENLFKDIVFYIPIIKSSSRLEFAVEKSVELGISEFVIFKADNSEKKKVNIERLEKIALSAMKQSLKCYKPIISFAPSLQEIKSKGRKFILMDQQAEKSFNSYLIDNSKEISGNYIFGPEGGLTKLELASFSDFHKVKISDYRLRTETAILSTAAIISSFLT